MAYLNGATTHENQALPVTAIPNIDPKSYDNFTAERLEMVRTQLTEPFDPGEIKWRVTATSTQQTKHGPQKRGQIIAYADQRAYTDRLNGVFGEWGWTRDYDVQVAQNFERRAPSDKTQNSVAAKVVIVSRVTIRGLGTHTGVGEEWADDENAATSAEAQAFKRACTCFGLGRYLYDLDKMWVDLDQYNRPAYTPSLPDWALPSRRRLEQRAPTARSKPAEPRQGVVREETLAAVKSLCEHVGHSLSLFVLHKYGGVSDPKTIGFAKLTTVMDKLSDIKKGLDRLQTARTAIGEARYSTICRDLNFASESIDDVPHRDALRILLERVEAEAAQKERTPGSSPIGGGISEARGHLLQAARRVADKTRKRLADVITEASAGTLSLDTLKSLTDVNIPEVEAATARLREQSAYR